MIRILLSSLLILFTTIPISAMATIYGYVGSKACKVCHIQEYRGWKRTAMAYSFDSLKPLEKHEEKKNARIDHLKDYTIEPECLHCHVTGFGRRGGFVNILESPDMVGVGCEMCHGPGSEYIKIMIANPQFERGEVIDAGLKMGEEEICLRCHNEKSPSFDPEHPFNYKEGVRKGVHEINR